MTIVLNDVTCKNEFPSLHCDNFFLTCAGHSQAFLPNHSVYLALKQFIYTARPLEAAIVQTVTPVTQFFFYAGPSG
jgi:hypothetical protein